MLRGSDGVGKGTRGEREGRNGGRFTWVRVTDS